MRTLIKNAMEEIEEHQKEVLRLRKYIEKLQSECSHKDADPRDYGTYRLCHDCGKLF